MGRCWPLVHCNLQFIRLVRTLSFFLSCHQLSRGKAAQTWQKITSHWTGNNVNRVDGTNVTSPGHQAKMASGLSFFGSSCFDKKHENMGTWERTVCFPQLALMRLRVTKIHNINTDSQLLLSCAHCWLATKVFWAFWACWVRANLRKPALAFLKSTTIPCCACTLSMFPNVGRWTRLAGWLAGWLAGLPGRRAWSLYHKIRHVPRLWTKSYAYHPDLYNSYPMNDIMMCVATKKIKIFISSYVASYQQLVDE